jgi:excisionase family DNA binding protein
MESMMTVRQVAELLGVHENWVYDQAASGQLPSYKIGGTRRIDRDEFRAWIAEHREGERPARPERKPKRRRPKTKKRPDDEQPRLFE